MLELTVKLEAGNVPDSAALVTDELSLPYDLRKRGRLRATTVKGIEVGLFLERGKVLVSGDLLRASSGEIIRVISSAEAVVTAQAEDELSFARICYHLGNRHVPLQIGPRWLRFQPDHVLEALVRQYGLQVNHEQAPFEPENGAYGEHGGHRHGPTAVAHFHDEHTLYQPLTPENKPAC